MGDDRRREHREPVVLVVDYDGADDLVGDYTENLSTGGTFIHTERDLEAGTAVQLVLSFPGLVHPIPIDGVVRWARGAVPGGDEPGIGIEFVRMDDESRYRLEQVIAAIARRDPTYVGRIVKVLVVEDNPHVARLIREGLEVMRHWGFTYKTNLVWYKVRQDGGPDRRGVGFYFRNVTELVLFGTHGTLRTLAPGRRQENIIVSRKRQHSRKPDALYDIIEQCSPGPYLELFARQERPAWTQWGNESF